MALSAFLSTAAKDLQVLKNRHFRRLFIARTTSTLGSAMAPVAIAFAFLNSGQQNAATDLGLILAAGALTHTLFLLFGGVLADRLPRHKLMVGAEILSGASQIAAAFMFLTGHPSVWGLAVLYAVKGTAASLFMPASSSILPQTVAPEDLQPANALLRLSANVSRLLGAGLAGVVTTVWGAAYALAFDAFTFFVSALFISLASVVVSTRPVESKTSFAKDLRLGWIEFRSRQWVWILVLQAAAVNVCVGAFLGVWGPNVAHDRLGGALSWSMILTAQSVGFLVGSLLALRVRPRRPLMAAAILAGALAAPLLTLGIGLPVYLVAIAAFIYAVCADLYGTLWDSTLQTRVPRDVLSRVVSYDMLGSFVAAPLGLALAGVLASKFGGSTVLVCAAIAVLATVPLVLLSPAVRKLTGPTVS